MANRVLILSSKDDAHAVCVQTHLNQLGVEPIFWRFENFIQGGQLNFEIADQCGQFTIKLDGKLIDLRSFDAIWFRRPGPLISRNFPEPWVAKFIEVEARQALMGMLYGLHSLWVNYPPRDTTAMLKLFQLQVAKNVGLKIPETIVTNEPDIARSFYDKFEGLVIYKLVTELSNFALPAYEFPHGIPTLPLREVDLQHIEQVKHGPHLFQQKVNKQSDIRVTVIGQKIFAANIESQKGTGKLDWRNDYSVPMNKWNLSDEISQKCLEVLRVLGLNYGAFDFCLDQDNQYLFLEVNPAGQYLWLEERTEQNLSKEMALLLSGASPPLVSYETAAFGDRATLK